MSDLARRFGLDAVAFVWGVAEATLFFIVPDVILSYVGLRRGPRSAAIASLYAAIGAGLGGAIMYLWSAHAHDAARAAVLAVPTISDSMADAAHASISEHGWFLATLSGPLTSTPYKVYAILAPETGAPLLLFALASIVARLPRFLLVSCGVALLGRALSRWLSSRQLIWILGGAWLVFYAAFFAIVPS